LRVTLKLDAPNRHARGQAFGRRDDGFRDLGTPVADGLCSL